MYVCMYVFMYVCMCEYVCIYVHCMYVCMYVWMYYVCMCSCVFISFILKDAHSIKHIYHILLVDNRDRRKHFHNLTPLLY